MDCRSLRRRAAAYVDASPAAVCVVDGSTTVRCKTLRKPYWAGRERHGGGS